MSCLDLCVGLEVFLFAMRSEEPACLSLWFIFLIICFGGVKHSYDVTPAAVDSWGSLRLLRIESVLEGRALSLSLMFTTSQLIEVTFHSD